MYFFLHILSALEICSTSVTIPLLLHHLLTGQRHIPHSGCTLQMFFFLCFGANECCLLGLRGSSGAGPQHTSFIFSLPCCGPNAIPHFFCEIQPVLQLVCIDTSVNEQQNILAAVLIILCPFGLILSSYGWILVTIFSIPSAAGRGLHLFFPPRSGISLLRYCHLYLYLP
ncbi:hypothetical protein ACRRTK_013046 [Alexandromys fortis]